MADLVVPQLGESITEAVISRWLKEVGDAVAVDEPIAELETDKITVQLPSPVAGALSDVKAKVGATVRVGQVIGSVEAGKAGKSAAAPATANPTPPPLSSNAPPTATHAPVQHAVPTQKSAAQPQPTTQLREGNRNGGNGQPLDKD